MESRPASGDNDVDRPPLFSSWKRLYLAVLLNLAVQVALFYLFRKAFE